MARLRPLDASYRWLVGRDLDDVLLMEACASREPWTEQHYRAMMAKTDAGGLVVERWGDLSLAAVMLYRLFDDRYRIDRLVVHPFCQRRGVGTAFVKLLMSRLEAERRMIDVPVPERDVAMQCLLRDLGFEHWSTIPHRDRSEGDLYCFRHRWQRPGQATANREARRQPMADRRQPKLW